jgi:5-(carboxyamino)imidazole ribonucleotide synthase
VIPPGSTIGILGGGQLGRMSAQAAQAMGYRVVVLEPGSHPPAGSVAHRVIAARYDDPAALAELAAACDVVTVEFENIPAAPLRTLAARRPVHPSPEVLHTCQNRLREKRFLRDHGFPHAPFIEVRPGVPLVDQVRGLGWPCVLKTADFGYDGKGQRKLAGPDDAAAAQAQVDAGGAWVVEGWVDFACELSVLCARGTDGRAVCFPPALNEHAHHILDVSLFPAPLPAATIREATALATAVASALGLVGLVGVEMFLARDGRVLVNELAPRPHNSGHATIEACGVSQFGQFIRAVCGLPLAEPRVRRPAAMVNLLGDLWAAGVPDWTPVFAAPDAHLHLYGKGDPRPGRKMGHITVLDDTVEAAAARARALRTAIARR